ncbi:hypothetical protein [Micromonospora sp. CB01531]|uniref:hypothetical protein n=1 Tax=Micromonospora sp. CB01531 TaxID=1718947 RepID=UPI00093AC544|nr:hypothetical protein [Micromonospora sp. CB01531]OKI51405.1 hypothetical protein A6A27_33565 [Micromonospora sp. CB01531]
MPTTSAGDGTAELLDALRRACPDVADDAFAAVAAMLGAPPDGAPPDVEPAGRLRWSSMTLGDIPGLNQVLQVITSPLQVIAAVLDFLAGILDVLSALLIDILDPFRALILAAYEILRSIMEDLLNSGAYLYADVIGLSDPSLTRPPVSPSADAGKWVPGGPPLVISPVANGFDAWAARFRASFDDPGDQQRPIFSDGAPVEAVFVVSTAPDLDGLSAVLGIFEKLFDVSAFGNAWRSFAQTFPQRPPDPQRTRGRTSSVAPDWRSWKLRDIAPPDYPLEKLLWVPWLLKALLLNVDGVIGLLKKLAAAVKEKAALLRRLVAILQSVIDAILALSATGLHALVVVTDEGVAGLTEAFLAAENRPNTDAQGRTRNADLVAGVCLLAGTTELVPANALPIWGLFGQQRSLEQAYSGLIADGRAIGAKADKALGDTVALGTGAWEGTAAGGSTPARAGVTGLWEKLKDTAGDRYDEVLDILGLDDDQARQLSATDAGQLAAILGSASAAGRVKLDPRVLAHVEAARRAGSRGNRSLAGALGLRTAGPEGGGR